MIKPNFFIVGAPKCGTTALYRYLKTHPDIYMSVHKEPHYFSTDFSLKHRTLGTKKDYLQECFPDVKPHHKAVGEASASYLYSKEALKNIRNFNPEAKIIVMIRNPVDMVHSLHSQAFYSFYEDEKDFKKAWDLQALRKQGRKIPRLCKEPLFLQYFDVACYSGQIKRVYEHFSKDQVKIIFFDDFCNNTQQIYKGISQFLKVSDDGREAFPVINENKKHKARLLGQFIVIPPAFIVELAMTFKKITGIKRLGVIDALRKLETKTECRQSLNCETRKMLQNAFYDEIKELESLTGRSLSKWLEPLTTTKTDEGTEECIQQKLQGN